MARPEGALTKDAIAGLVGLKAADPIGFYGVTPVVQASIAAAGTDAATTQTLANDLRTKLIALGLVV
ncbi:hypothetical protein LCGC14_2204660 [marine sediment metagenome]|uniref:Uncharacterized protein n=1 Tax=marine sediment metagenome TaxID=412755 RepID=A0A0F9DFK6_9ZZZZ